MKAAVAAGHDLTARSAIEMITAGGNAFDAVLAAMLTSCVSEPVLASPGGGGYLMARDGLTREIGFYDFFVQTPLRKQQAAQTEFYAAHADFGKVTQEFHIGAGAAAVPSLLPGFFDLHAKFASLSTKQVIAPALRAARQGVEISPFQAYLFSVIEPIITAHPDVKALFLQSGTLPKAGDQYCSDGMANLFEAMAYEGEKICQQGGYVDAILEQSERHGGHLIREDFTRYQVHRHKPLEIPFLGYKIYLPPLPAAGGTLIAFGLLLLDKLVQERKIKSPDLVDLVRIMEQSHIVRGRSPEKILEPSHVSESLQALGQKSVVCKGTTHISAIDENLNIAALTLTNGEGNGRLVGDYGFMLNNMLGEEDLHPNGFHNWTEGERLSSMMAPTIIQSRDGRWTALGSGGSNRIRTAILQVIVNLVMREMSLEQAIDTARLHAEKCGTISFEQSVALDSFTKQDLDSLSAAYPDIHNWTERNLFFGGVHAVSGGTNHAFRAAADKRRSGCALTL